MMKKNKGFTLIELLAVIVILAIIALIAVPQILNILNKARLNAAKDSTYGIVKTAQTYATNFMLENNGDIPSEPLEFECNSNGCNLQTSLTGYKLDKLQTLDFKGSKPTSGKVTISNNGKDIVAENLQINGFSCSYANDTVNCTKGDNSETTEPTTPVKPELIKPTAESNPSGYSQSKTVTISYIGEGTYLLMPTVNVKTNIEATTCSNVEDASFTCDGAAVSANGTMIANTWYKVESNPTLTLEENGSIYYKVTDGTNYKDGGSLTISEIDRTAPTNVDFSAQINSNGSVTVTASGTDNESGIVGYQFSIDNGEWEPSSPQISNTYTFNDVSSENHQISVRIINGTYTNDGQNLLNTITISKKTYNITNLIENGSFENGLNRWNESISVGDRDANVEISTSQFYIGNSSYMLYHDNSDSNRDSYVYYKSTSESKNNFTLINHHIYYGQVKTLSPNSASGLTLHSPDWNTSDGVLVTSIVPSSNNWINLSIYTNIQCTADKIGYYRLENRNSGTDAKSYFDGVILIDLTEAFGAGNEPTSEWCDKNISYFDGTTKIYK